jgi:hypothetical protein
MTCLSQERRDAAGYFAGAAGEEDCGGGGHGFLNKRDLCYQMNGVAIELRLEHGHLIVKPNSFVA